MPAVFVSKQDLPFDALVTDVEFRRMDWPYPHADLYVSSLVPKGTAYVWSEPIEINLGLDLNDRIYDLRLWVARMEIKAQIKRMFDDLAERWGL